MDKHNEDIRSAMRLSCQHISWQYAEFYQKLWKSECIFITTASCAVRAIFSGASKRNEATQGRL